MIKVVFVDIDNTLLDFDKCAKVAMKYCMDQFGVMYEEKLYETFLEVNDSLWLEIERGELTRQGLYEIRWNRIFNRLGINIDGVEFEKRFVAVLENCAEPVDGAMKMLEYLASKYFAKGPSLSLAPTEENVLFIYTLFRVMVLSLIPGTSFQKIIYHAIHCRCSNAIHKHRSCNDEHFCTHTKHIALGFVFHGRRHNAVGKSRYGHECACFAVARNVVIHTDSCEKRTNQNK